MRPSTPCVALAPGARILTWPNAIRAEDWSGWDGPRAPVVPGRVDAPYTHVIETHDPGQPDNRDALLVAPLGRGTYVYTALTLDRQIAAGVPGAIRLLANMLSTKR